MTPIAVGERLPEFTASSTQGPIGPATFKGHKVVLFFYPKDNTPGCTTEANDFRELHEEFGKHQCQVIGVSRDSLASHERFIQKHQLPFPLIADTDEALCGLFDVIKPKNMYGRMVRGIERSTFLIDAEGMLLREWRKVRVPGHAAEVLKAVAEYAVPTDR